MRKPLPLLSLFGLFFLSTSLFAADFYRWTDEHGLIHFSDSISGIPKQYRKKALEGTFDQESPKKKSFEARSKSNMFVDTEASVPSNALKIHSVPYTAFEGRTSRVIIDVRFNDRITAPMVLDTGAGEVFISEGLAEKLGLFEHEHAKLNVSVSGFGGTAPAIRTILDRMKIGDIESQFIPTRIVPSLSKVFEGVVGMNFMSNYKIRIDPRKQVLVFEELPNLSPHFGGHGERWWRQYFAEFEHYHKKSQHYVASLERYLRENRLDYQSVLDPVREELKYAKTQDEAAKKLLEKLTRYASQNQVPIAWRRLNH